MACGRKLLLIGGGGHCQSVLDCVPMDQYEAIGIVEKPGFPVQNDSMVVGTDDDLPLLFQAGWTDAFITVGSIGDTSLRRKLFDRIKELGFYIPCIIDVSATVSENVAISKGVFVGKRAVINTGSSIGKCAIVNTGAIIEHDCEIGAFTHVSPGAILCGGVKIGNDSHVGAGSVIRQGLMVGERTMIGLGSVVVRNLPSEVQAYGNPCKVVI